jgi:hypothetical protein
MMKCKLLGISPAALCSTLDQPREPCFCPSTYCPSPMADSAFRLIGGKIYRDDLTTGICSPLRIESADVSASDGCSPGLLSVLSPEATGSEAAPRLWNITVTVHLIYSAALTAT